ncbi:pantetheine-phosphate adenylyltransferase [Candidatus Margulisiibacteriota bacterium]
MTKKAIYPGSFDPITNGHIDIVKRAKRLFDEVCIVVIDNPSKTPLFTQQERIDLTREVFADEPGIIVKGFNGLLVDFARQENIFNIIRGLRAVSDFDYEFQMALTNRKLEPSMNLVFFMTDAAYTYLHSGLVKELAVYNANIDSFVPVQVKEKLVKKVIKRNE